MAPKSLLRIYFPFLLANLLPLHRAMNEYDRKVQEALDKENVDKKKENQKKLAHPVSYKTF